MLRVSYGRNAILSSLPNSRYMTSMRVEYMLLFFSSRSFTAVAVPSRIKVWVPSLRETTGPSGTYLSVLMFFTGGVEHTFLCPFLKLQMQVCAGELMQITDNGEGWRTWGKVSILLHTALR